MRLSPKRLQESLCSDDDDRRVLHAVLACDEPEAHLHPYMQRRLSKSLHRICEGKDDGFNALLKVISEFQKQAFCEHICSLPEKELGQILTHLIETIERIDEMATMAKERK